MRRAWGARRETILRLGRTLGAAEKLAAAAGRWEMGEHSDPIDATLRAREQVTERERDRAIERAIVHDVDRIEDDIRAMEHAREAEIEAQIKRSQASGL